MRKFTLFIKCILFIKFIPFIKCMLFKKFELFIRFILFNQNAVSFQLGYSFTGVQHDDP